MKARLPDSVVARGHPDHRIVTGIAQEITARAGGKAPLAQAFSQMLRTCIDDVILTPKTGRRSYDDLEKTEKTYIGTRVEIELRALLDVPKGKLDTVILGYDVDIKHTMGSNWMIPSEAFDHPCLLVAADEARALCYLGVVVARPDYLTRGQNRDAKKTFSAAGFAHIHWLLRDHAYPPNFWRAVSEDAVRRIFAGASGNERMAQLFRELQGRPIAREVVEAVARQKDFMRRIRADKGHGTRDILAREGLLLLSGHADADLIRELGLPPCNGDSFVSYRPETALQIALARAAGHALD